MSDDNRFDYVNVRTWNTKGNPESFPEVNDPGVAVPWLRNRPSFGIAFSGGGTRSAAATLGQLRALQTLGWIDQARYISANSGGSWTSVPFVFLPEGFDETRFLGPYIPPEEISDERLKADDHEHSMEGVIFRSRLVDPTDPDRLWSLFKGDESYTDFVGTVFLERFGLHNRAKFFSSHDAALDAILRGNSDLRPEDFYLARERRPFLIVVGTLLSPVKERFLVEATPLYVGVRNEFRQASVEEGSKEMLIGGGYVEPFGYDSNAPETDSLKGNRWRVGLKGGLLRTNKRHRFTLSDMIGMSSAAPAITLANKNIKTEIFPEFRHWAIDRQQVMSDATLLQDAKELKHGDGGDIDNLALLPLLARKVENILVFINTRTPFSTEESCSRVTTKVLVDDLVSLFRPIEKHADNVVFADGEVQLSKICHEFLKLKRTGEPLVYCQRYEIKDNPRQGVRGGDYRPNICWVYLDRSEQWINLLPHNDAWKCTQDLKNRRGDFKHFPHYATFGEEGSALIDLDRERVRALSNLTAWTLFKSAPYIVSKLPGASLTTEKRPLGD